jgi:hypothetical protein
MTPEDVSPDIVTADSLFPWLHAIAPPAEPVRRLPEAPRAERPQAEQPLRPAA